MEHSLRSRTMRPYWFSTAPIALRWSMRKVDSQRYMPVVTGTGGSMKCATKSVLPLPRLTSPTKMARPVLGVSR